MSLQGIELGTSARAANVLKHLMNLFLLINFQLSYKYSVLGLEFQDIIIIYLGDHEL